MGTETVLALSHKEFLRVDKDHEKAASAANLVYVRDCQPGILRVKKGKGFSYLLNNRVVRDRHLLERIRKLVIHSALDEEPGSVETRRGIYRPPGWTFAGGSSTAIIRCGTLYAMRLNFIAFMNLARCFLYCEAR